MAGAAYRTVISHHGPELALSVDRFRSYLPQCRYLYLDRCNGKVCFDRLFVKRRLDVRHLHPKCLQRSRASSRDNSNGSSQKGKIIGDISDDDEGADSETDGIEDVRDKIQKDKKAASQLASEQTAGFWRNLLRKVRQEIDEVDQARTNEDDSDSEQEEEQIVAQVQEEEVLNSVEDDLSETEPSKTRFWERWWKRDTETPDVDVGTRREDEMLLQDLANLQFRWKDLLEPTPENLLALALTTLLALAGLQIIWQMVVVATSITLSALKYSVLAAIIVGLLIFLL